MASRRKPRVAPSFFAYLNHHSGVTKMISFLFKQRFTLDFILFMRKLIILILKQTLRTLMKTKDSNAALVRELIVQAAVTLILAIIYGLILICY